jgi:hypothetical protein
MKATLVKPLIGTAILAALTFSAGFWAGQRSVGMGRWTTERERVQIGFEEEEDDERTVTTITNSRNPLRQLLASATF